MKMFLSYTVAAVIIGFGVFAIMYWLFGFDFSESKTMAVTTGVTCLIVELLRPQIARWSTMFDITASRKPAKK